MPPPRPLVPEEIPITHKITITEGISIKELSEKLEARAKDVIKRLLDKGIFATINQTLDSQTATEISRAFGAEATVISYEEEVIHEVEEADRPEDLIPRAPVVTVMGHVDHGKTSLLDAIRETSVAAREAGGITQHIGAYQVEAQARKIVFLDTPGHEAFTMMRARGSKATDIVVLVVAADDGVMPQTLEAINHARAAKVPIVVAVNKIDKPEAQPERVKRQLADQNLMPEEWGGETVTVEVSAKQRKNLSLLLEMILLVADMQQLKANPKRPAAGTVLEAKLDRGRGPVATVLVQNGTLRVGDAFIIGSIYGKVRAMLDDRGRPVLEAPPATPVEVLGLEDVPQAGDKILAIEDTAKARQIALHRQAKQRDAALAKSARLTLEQLHERMAAGDVKELPLIIKADVQGSVEVLVDTLNKLSTEKVKVKVIHAGVGAITEWDVLLAVASNAVIIGFSVRPERKAAELAALERVDIRLHTIIYNVTDEIKKAMVGLLAAVIKETTLGRAAVRDTFRISKVGTIAGCYVQDGKLTRDAKVRLLRDNVVVYEGKARSLRHFKEDVNEVRNGMECGIALENFNDVKIGDVIEAYVVEKVESPTLDAVLQR
jgi:translation initiation factor IF-2